MKMAVIGWVGMGLALAVLPAGAQNSPAAPPSAKPSDPPTRPPPPATAPGEMSHDEMVAEQERRDREEQAERDRDDL